MPGVIPPGQGISQLQGGYDKSRGNTAGGTSAPVAQPTHALSGWHDVNRAVATALPLAIFRAGQYHHAGLLALRKRSKVRR